ncbi:MAG TPA: hydrogenase maturation nickel metallochaperone HypA [Anaerolineales bacterium]|nr:hydrogenase maturation nickel metallochaperone HypA [Anaerolineales bacterium]
MHELAVTENILNLALESANNAGAARVTDLYLVIGSLSSIVDESVQFYWDIIAEGTICQDATMHFERMPARLMCQDCSKEYQLERDLEFCPACRSSNVKIVQGDEFRLESIGIDTESESV